MMSSVLQLKLTVLIVGSRHFRAMAKFNCVRGGVRRISSVAIDVGRTLSQSD